ncbi:MAG: site-specific DNA-methyltransferase [Lachnospiraceae bacterium]|nr:site-specific DNA-methyltransferase [Lachnospiraceae bacterium]
MRVMSDKAARNKTIDFSLEDGQEYIKKCIRVEKEVSTDEVLDRIITGDSLKVMDLLPERSIDLMIVDPPYNIEKDFNGNRFHARSREKYRSYTEEWLSKAMPLLKDSASVYICCDWKSSLVIGDLLYDHLKVRNRITWQREKGRGAKTNWKNGMEDIWFATVSDRYTFNLEDVMIRRRVIAPYTSGGKPKDWEDTAEGRFRNTCPSNFWDDISIPYWSMAENTAHPTQKPEKLYAKLILASSNKGDVVFDPFAGSGTAAVTSKKLDRHFIAVEKEALYCAWAEKRLENALSDSTIQGYRDGVFWERNTGDAQRKLTKRSD